MSNTPMQKTGTDFLSLLNSKQYEAQFAKILPPNLTVDRFKRVVRTAFARNYDLQKLDPASIMLSVMTLASLGLEPDGRMAYLIPFKGKCTPMIGYIGYLERAKENGLHSVHFDNVFYNDKFKWKQTGDGLEFEHEQDFKNPDRGEMFAAYCVWKEKGSDALQGVIMPRLEIEKIRDSSPGKNQDPWRLHFLEMSKKTAIRRAQKQWPLDVKLDEAIKTGKVVDSEVINIESEIVPEIPPDAPEPTQAPAALTNPSQTPAQEAKRAVLEAGVEFDKFTAEMVARNIAKDADSIPDYDCVPADVWETLAAQPKTLSAIVKKWSKKPEAT